jgi:hypothetical protein
MRSPRCSTTPTGSRTGCSATVAGVAALAGSHHSNVVVVGGPPSASSTPTTTTVPVPTTFSGGSSAGTLPNGLRVEMTLATPTELLGSNIAYKIVLRNETGTPKTIGPGGIDCVLGGYAPALYDVKGTGLADKPPLASDCKAATTLAAGGVATFTGWLPAQRLGLKPGARHGHYTVRLSYVYNAKEPQAGSQPRVRLKPIPVEFNAPDLTVRIEIPNPSVRAGDAIKGDVVFANAGRTVVSAGCASTPNFAITLTSVVDGQVTLVNSDEALVNPSAPCAGRQVVLEPGTTRLPFSIAAKYSDCAPPLPSGQHLIDGPELPTCFSRHIAPPLPVGRYQLAYAGAAGVGAVVVPPASIEVRGSR